MVESVGLGRIFPMDGGLCLTRFIVVVVGCGQQSMNTKRCKIRKLTPVALEEAKVNA